MPSASVKRRRKRKRADEDGDPEFQVAPMVDVLLVLLLFFMSITSTELLKKDRNLQLADAKYGKKDEAKNKPGEIVVNVGWIGMTSTAIFSMDGQPFPDANSLQGAIAARAAKDPHSYVLIRADRNVEYSNIADLMNTCASAGIASVTFAVITGAKEPEHAPAGASN